MPKEQLKVWKPQPLYLHVYNVLRTLTLLGSLKYIELQKLYEVIKSDARFKDVDISLKDVLKAVMVLELNGLVATNSNGEDVRRMTVSLIQ